jgi:hypothetical protein
MGAGASRTAPDLAMAPEVRRHDQRPLPAPLDLQLARDLGRPTGVLWTVAFSG